MQQDSSSTLKVEVYWNLHKKCWSVRNTKTGRVIHHAKGVWLMNVSWVVRPAGNAKVRREGKKNVHAFGRGILISYSRNNIGLDYHPKTGRVVDVGYNPYRDTSFMQPYNGEEGVEYIPIHKSDNAVFKIVDGKPRAYAQFNANE